MTTKKKAVAHQTKSPAPKPVTARKTDLSRAGLAKSLQAVLNNGQITENDILEVGLGEVSPQLKGQTHVRLAHEGVTVKVYSRLDKRIS